MWIVNFLPSWFFYIILIAGIAGFVVSQFLKMIPLVGSNAVAIKYGSVVAILLGMWLCGADYNNSAWVARVKEMEEKVAAAEVKSKEQNKQIDNRAAAKTQVIRLRGETIVKYIESDVAKYNGQCVIPKEFVSAHNRAAEQPK